MQLRRIRPAVHHRHLPQCHHQRSTGPGTTRNSSSSGRRRGSRLRSRSSARRPRQRLRRCSRGATRRSSGSCSGRLLSASQVRPGCSRPPRITPGRKGAQHHPRNALRGDLRVVAVCLQCPLGDCSGTSVRCCALCCVTCDSAHPCLHTAQRDGEHRFPQPQSMQQGWLAGSARPGADLGKRNRMYPA